MAKKRKKPPKVTSIDRARKKERPGGMWYEVTAYFDPLKIKTVDLPEAQGYRTFMHGTIPDGDPKGGDLTIIEADSKMPSQQIQQLGKSLGSMGINALIISDNVRFVKLRACSVEECELLDEADSEKKGRIFAPHVHGTGSESDGDGSSSRWPRSAPDSSGGDQDDAEDGDGSPPREDP